VQTLMLRASGAVRLCLMLCVELRLPQDMLFARGADVLRDEPEHEVIELVELLLGKGATINEIQYENHPQKANRFTWCSKARHSADDWHLR
jgi:hypothetical protein